MWLEKAILFVSKVLNIVGMVVLLAMMLLTVTDVFLRYAFRQPLLGSLELIEYFMVIVVYLAVAWCALRKGHVKVDLLVARFSPRLQAIIDSFTCFFSIIICSLITWRGFVEFRDIWLAHRESPLLGIPASPFHLLLSIGCAMLCLVLMADLGHFVAKAVQR